MKHETNAFIQTIIIAATLIIVKHISGLNFDQLVLMILVCILYNVITIKNILK